MVLKAIVFQKPSKTVLSINERSTLILERYIIFFSSAVSMGSEVVFFKMAILFHKDGDLVLQSFPLLLALLIKCLVVDSISVAVSIIDINFHVLAIEFSTSLELAYQWILVAVIVDCVFFISRPLQFQLHLVRFLQTLTYNKIFLVHGLFLKRKLFALSNLFVSQLKFLILLGSLGLFLPAIFIGG